ncbi:hypothetical protein [Massilia pseudoviolaceinigra]|uniref:hypothetical protein n=1 Tax=Massilia pseudoviolaceinigra TaxID=3057165 RepID=UPI0027964106|nr:hypothetical protein [Massilia sp. CCM 9206]MDQ1920554.1 hypothetical protein [Massilia sp. CCM 9206]
MTPIDARRAGFYGRRARTPMTATFTSSGTWTAPGSTTMVDSLVGKGSDGGAAPVLSASAVVATVFWYVGSGGANAGFYDWTSATNTAVSQRNAINAGGSPSYTFYNVGQFSNSTYTVTTAGRSESGVIAGSATISYESGWQSSGNISGGGSNQNWSATVSWNYLGSPTNGSNSTAFGYTFTGGISGGVAPTSTYYNITVIPGNGYSIVVPPGGSVTINYYQ